MKTAISTILFLTALYCGAQFKAKSGDIINISDTLVIGKTSNPLGFDYISQGGQRMHPSHAGKSVIITGTKVVSGKEYLQFKGFGLLPVFLDYDNAIESGEIINPKAKVTREQAILKLKEAKELLDLELISRQHYDSLKALYAPVITK